MQGRYKSWSNTNRIPAIVANVYRETR
jgi:hypothetical protein